MEKILMPGDMISDKPLRLEGSFIEDGKTFASVISLMRDEKSIPLKGYYLPRLGDYIVGIICDVRFSGYSVDLNAPFDGTISTRDVREELKKGDVVSAEIALVNESNNAVLSQVKKFRSGEGKILQVDAVKVPRIIGKNGSMLKMIQDYTKTELFVGKNGAIYLRGGDLATSILVIKMICDQAHTHGLTDRVKEFLEKSAKKA